MRGSGNNLNGAGTLMAGRGAEGRGMVGTKFEFADSRFRCTSDFGGRSKLALTSADDDDIWRSSLVVAFSINVTLLPGADAAEGLIVVADFESALAVRSEGLGAARV